MNKFFFCADTHGDFDHIFDAVEAHRPNAVVLLGDLQPALPLDEALAPIIGKTEIRYIHGNHDTDDAVFERNVFGSVLAKDNLHGRVEEIAGVRIAGLGGVFRGSVWRPPDKARFQRAAELACKLDHKERFGRITSEHAAEVRRQHLSTIFPDVYHRLAKQRADVLVTHEAPSCHPYGFAAVDQLAQSMGVRLAFHGHQHDRLDYKSHWPSLRFKAFGVGYRGITDGEGNVIVPGEFDEAVGRRNRGRSA